MTSRYRRFAAVALAVALTAPGVLVADAAAAEMVAADGSAVGKVTFEQTPHGVLMYVEVAGLLPGAHGIHLHAVGACTPDFKAATGHINPNKVLHGLRHPDGPDHGDLPNLYAAADGSARAEFFTVLVSVASGDMPALLDEDGSAVIIHENPDDHLTQPIGGAGGRIACGVIEPVPPVKAYENCADMRAAGWTRGVTRDGGTYRGSWDAAERETYRLNPSRDRDDDGHACE